MEDLSHLRIDEVYDADSNGELADPAATGDAWRVQRVYVNGPGQLGQIAKVIVFTYASPTTNTVASEDFYYYHYDILGNVSVISDPAGDEADQFEQDAFGNLVAGTWSGRVGGITEQITTKPYDADLGLYYFNARWYDPQLGAFVSADPYRNLHLDPAYTLSWNVPTLFVDPTGRKAYLIFYGHPGSGTHNQGRQFQLAAYTMKWLIEQRPDFNKRSDSVTVTYATNKHSDFFDVINSRGREDCIQEIHVFSHAWQQGIAIFQQEASHLAGVDPSLGSIDVSDYDLYLHIRDFFSDDAFVKYWGCMVGEDRATYLQPVANAWQVTTCGSPRYTHFVHDAAGQATPEGNYYMTPDRNEQYYCVNPE